MSDQPPDQPADRPRDEEETLAAMREEIDAVERHVLSQVEPRRRQAMTIAVGVFVLMVAFGLPWVGSFAGWRVLFGDPPEAAEVGVLPRLFVFSSLGIGGLLSAITLAVRRWALIWVCAVGCGFSVLHGLWAIWYRQSLSGDGPGVGMVLAMLVMGVITVQWVKIALARP